jgi:hypothetical protein
MRRFFQESNGWQDSRSDRAVVAGVQAGVSADRLDVLIDQISRGSRAAFVMLFDQTCGPVRDTLAARLPDPHWVSAVLAATYVEVWWLAGCRAGRHGEAVAWIDAIVQRRIGEVLRSEGRSDLSVSASGTAAVRARYAVLELAALLGRPAENDGGHRPGRDDVTG